MIVDYSQKKAFKRCSFSTKLMALFFTVTTLIFVLEVVLVIGFYVSGYAIYDPGRFEVWSWSTLMMPITISSRWNGCLGVRQPHSQKPVISHFLTEEPPLSCCDKFEFQVKSKCSETCFAERYSFVVYNGSTMGTSWSLEKKIDFYFFKNSAEFDACGGVDPQSVCPPTIPNSYEGSYGPIECFEAQCEFWFVFSSPVEIFDNEKLGLITFSGDVSNYRVTSQTPGYLFSTSSNDQDFCFTPEQMASMTHFPDDKPFIQNFYVVAEAPKDNPEDFELYPIDYVIRPSSKLVAIFMVLPCAWLLVLVIVLTVIGMRQFYKRHIRKERAKRDPFPAFVFDTLYRELSSGEEDDDEDDLHDHKHYHTRAHRYRKAWQVSAFETETETETEVETETENNDRRPPAYNNNDDDYSGDDDLSPYDARRPLLLSQSNHR